LFLFLQRFCLSRGLFGPGRGCWRSFIGKDHGSWWVELSSAAVLWWLSMVLPRWCSSGIPYADSLCCWSFRSQPARWSSTGSIATLESLCAASFASILAKMVAPTSRFVCRGRWVAASPNDRHQSRHPGWRALLVLAQQQIHGGPLDDRSNVESPWMC